MQPWQQIGKHRIRIEQDVVFVVTQGDISGNEVIALCEQLLQIQQQYGWAFELVDASAGGSMSAEARRQSAEWYRHHSLDREAVVFGASLIFRTIMSLVANGLRMLGSSQLQVRFVATEAEARAWVAKRREEKRAALGSR